MTPDPTTPAYQMARWYMRGVKGLNVIPHDHEQLDGQECHYFYYTLPEGELELEVLWDPGKRDWEIAVTSFPAVI